MFFILLNILDSFCIERSTDGVFRRRVVPSRFFGHGRSGNKCVFFASAVVSCSAVCFWSLRRPVAAHPLVGRLRAADLPMAPALFFRWDEAQEHRANKQQPRQRRQPFILFHVFFNDKNRTGACQSEQNNSAVVSDLVWEPVFPVNSSVAAVSSGCVVPRNIRINKLIKARFPSA